MLNNGFELSVLVNGIRLPEYLYSGNFYVEGREGYEFEVKIKNNTHKRILAVPSIDGRSVMNGELASADSTGYVIAPRSEYSIKGWRRDNDNTAKFIFSKTSYAERIGDSGVNNGVIGVLIYDEKPPVYIQPLAYTSYVKCAGTPHLSYNACKIGASGSFGALGNKSISDAPRGIAPMGDAVLCSNSMDMGAASAVVTTGFSLGTDYGREVTDKVKTTTFDRGVLSGEFNLFYAPLESLIAWGIDIKTPQPTVLPQPFGSSGCPAPVGWSGVKPIPSPYPRTW